MDQSGNTLVRILYFHGFMIHQSYHIFGNMCVCARMCVCIYAYIFFGKYFFQEYALLHIHNYHSIFLADVLILVFPINELFSAKQTPKDNQPNLLDVWR